MCKSSGDIWELSVFSAQFCCASSSGTLGELFLLAMQNILKPKKQTH